MEGFQLVCQNPVATLGSVRGEFRPDSSPAFIRTVLTRHGIIKHSQARRDSRYWMRGKPAPNGSVLLNRHAPLVSSAVDAGASSRAAPTRFGFVSATAIRWHAHRRETGSIAPRLQGGGTRSWPIDVHRPNCSGEGSTSRISLSTSCGSSSRVQRLTALHAFFVQHGISREQDRTCG